MPLPRLVAFDLDGTLLDGDKRLTERTAQAVRALSAAGCHCLLASGRMYRDCMEPLVARLGLTTPVIGYNGALVVDPSDNTVLSENPIPADLVVELMRHADEHRRHLNLYHDDRLYCRARNHWSELYQSRTGAVTHYRDDLYTWFAGRPSTKCLLLDQPAAIARILPEFQERYSGRLHVTVSDPEYLELGNPGATKGWALRAVCERLGVPVSESVAFGDSLNDLPLLEAAGRAYAMANANPRVKAAADRIAPAHTEDGVARVLEAWLRGEPEPEAE